MAIVIAAAAIGVLVLMLALPPLYYTSDEAKYVGLGLNILAGRGIVTDYGTQFLNHSPVWPLVLAAPQAWFGVEGLTVGHLVNAASAAATVTLTGLLAWRVRPAAGALAAVAMLGLPYLTTLSRTAGLDMPAVAFTLGYLWVALRALDRGSIGLGLLAGLLFGAGFLIKETALPFLPVPFLAALAAPVTIGTMARVGGAALLTAALTTSWWFAMVAALGGTVYRLGTPAWTLAPLTVLVVVLIVLGLGAGRIEAWLVERGRWPAVSEARSSSLLAIAGWAGLVIWIAGQLFVFGRAGKLGGAGLVRLDQLADDARVYGEQLAPVVAFGVLGAVLALRLVPRSPSARALLYAALSWIPLLLLVLAIGETPRHYVAAVSVVIALGACGWVAAAESAVRGDRRWLVAVLGAAAVALVIAYPVLPGHRTFKIAVLGAGAVVAVAWLVVGWLAARRAGGETPSNHAVRVLAGGATLLLAMLLIVGVVVARDQGTRSVAFDRGRASAVEDVSAWVQANAGPGSVVAVSHRLGYELAVSDRDRRYVRIGPKSAVVDPRSPSGFRWQGDGRATDVVALDAALHRVDSLDAFGAGELTDRITAIRPGVWVETAILPSGQALGPMQAMLDNATGIDRSQLFRYPAGKRDLLVAAYTVDPDRVQLDTESLFAAPLAVQSIADRLTGSDGSAAAAVLDRLVLVPDDAVGETARAALEAVAGDGASPSPGQTPSSASPSTSP